MSDQLIKALAYDDQIRIFVVDATQTVSQAQIYHDTWHTATAALGRSLVATLLLAANLKGEDKLGVQIKGSGPLGMLVTDGNSQGEVRGYVNNPHVALELNSEGKLDVAAAVGLPGLLQVRRNIAGGDPFTGQVSLISGELGEDFTYYMAVSEQTPSAFGLSVLINPDEKVLSAGGFMIQVLPGASEETVDELEKRIASLGKLSDLIDQSQGLSYLLEKLVGEGNYRVIATQQVAYSCPCSKDSFTESMTVISPSEIMEMIKEDHGAEVCCHFCNKKYFFNEEDLKQILERQAE